MDKVGLATGAISLHDLWRNVEQNYNDAAAHKAFLEGAEFAGNIGFAAAKYQSVLATQPDDRMAKSQLDEIGRRTLGSVAAVRMRSTSAATAHWQKSRRLGPLALAALAVAITAFAAVMLNVSKNDHSSSDMFDGTAKGVGFDAPLVLGLLVGALALAVFLWAMWDTNKK